MKRQFRANYRVGYKNNSDMIYYSEIVFAETLKEAWKIARTKKKIRSDVLVDIYWIVGT